MRTLMKYMLFHPKNVLANMLIWETLANYFAASDIHDYGYQKAIIKELLSNDFP